MKKMKSAIAILLASTLMLGGCGSGSNTAAGGPTKGEGAAKKDVIIVAQSADPKSLNPYGTTDTPAGRVSTQIFETLVNRDDSGTIIPGLAESWEIVDDTTYVFHLRKGAKFHNGEEFKASDVAFSFQEISKSPHASSVYATIDFANSKVVDDYTFEMKMTKPFGPILNHLCHQVMAIVNEKAFTEAGDAVAQNPVGTGPYKFVEWQAGDNIKLTRHDDYWGEKAKTKDVIFRCIPETSSRSIEVETGGVDVALGVQPSEIARLEGNPKVAVSRREAPTTNFVALTTTRPPLDNIKVRQAINMAINKQAIVDVVYQGTGKVARGPMSPTIWAFNESLPVYPYDVEAAKALLAEAGFPDGFKTTITTNEDQVRLDISEMVQAQLSPIGIEVEIVTMEWGAFIEKVYAGTLDMFALGWTADTGDPDYALYASFHSSMRGEGGNMSYYENAEVDKLLDLGRSSTDEAVRKEAYAKAQAIIWEEVPCVFLQHAEDIDAHNANLKGFTITPSGRLLISQYYYE